ncbi:RNA polymerase sigma factor [Sphingobacterium gobiense]|uniref:RNA polymerase sigma-70 region 2 domain-containing protein n=1 Tax=Sphingobacterium gobiense TaxID=1382456 RepID=A0A2S9JD55_9SPHI|nr:sigma factor [Sphingobacterium gobiense]PRD50801.1 hypothetical protein C5749_19115 [Sphingobacterium gobiense]
MKTSEEKLLCNAEQSGFDKFYNTNFLKVKTSLLFLGVEEEMAKDITQESFLRILLLWNNFENDIARRSFLKLTSRNLWIDKYRKIKREEQFCSLFEEGSRLLEEQMDFKELQEITYQALDQYEENMRLMYFEIKLNGASYKDVSQKYQVNIKTLERYMTKMSKTVRLYLKKYYPHLGILAVFLL